MQSQPKYTKQGLAVQPREKPANTRRALGSREDCFSLHDHMQQRATTSATLPFATLPFVAMLPSHTGISEGQALFGYLSGVPLDLP